MKNDFMNLKTASFAAIFFIISCKKNEPAVSLKPAQDSVTRVSDFAKVVNHKNNQLITSAFYDYEEIGDYLYLIVKDNGETEDFVVQNVDKSLNRGDIVEVKWKKGNIEIAGDDNKKKEEKILVSVKKIKDGALSLFKLQYKKPVKFTYATDFDITDKEKDEIYNQVQYYLANTKNKLLQLEIKENTELTYSIEEQDEKGKNYIVLGIGKEFENRFSVIQWLYIDKQNGKLYEYDLPNDKLIPFE
ncbi:hypothetical protein M2U08_03855 [Elizabethkingia meningoseptica]|nr:hypothetical protein [Elizabethkingia meningoseptica]